jgi:sporulation protein YqfC
MPKEVVFNLPIIQALGAEEVNINNYKSLVEYSGECVRINTVSGIVRFEGNGLVLRHVTSEYISVSGCISKIEFIK